MAATKITLTEVFHTRALQVQLVLGVATAVAVWFVSAAVFHRQHPVQFFENGSYITPFSSPAGEQLTVVWKVNVRESCSGTVERIMLSPAREILVRYDPTIPATTADNLGPGTIKKTFATPRSLPQGKIIYRAVLSYECNWLQRMFPVLSIRYTTPDLEFEIL